jgi:hypothetical protein
MGYIGQAPTKIPLTSADITDGTIALADMAANSVDSDQYVDASVDLAHMSSQSVDEDNLHISNSGSNGQFLSKQSGDAGGLTWAAAGVNVHIAAGSWDTSTTGTIVVTGAGFAPKGGVVFSFVQTVAKGGTWAVTADGIADEVMYDYGGVTAGSYASNAGMVSLLLTDGSNYAKLVLTYDADGFTLTKSKVGSPTGTGYWKIFLVG